MAVESKEKGGTHEAQPPSDLESKGVYMTSWTERNPNREVEGMLDRTDVTGESGEGEGASGTEATGFRAQRVQFDLSLSQGFNEPFAHVIETHDRDGCRVWSIYSWRSASVVAEFEIQPGGELDELIDVIYELIDHQ